jgi:hypothetical protein
MDRIFFYPGELLQDTDLLNMQKNAMLGMGAILEMLVGQNTVACGFTCSALGSGVVSGSAFAVSISRGFLTSYQEVDPNAFGSVGADVSRTIMKCGINLSAANIGLTNAAPTTAGQSVNYLISCAFSEVDEAAVVLPYVNASNPSVPWSGQSNSGTAQNTVRQQQVVFTSTPGSPATTGTQTTPAAPSGYFPLFVVTITNGQTAVSGGNISTSPLALIITNNLISNSPGLQTLLVYQGNTSFTVPHGVYNLKITAVGGGGGGGSTVATSSGQYSVGSGGNAGATGVRFLQSVLPGTVISWTVGAGGAAASNGGATIVYENGGEVLAAGGGGAGVTSIAAAPPFVTNPFFSGVASALYGAINMQGGCGSPGLAISTGANNAFGGHGGASSQGAGASGTGAGASGQNGNNATSIGSGGGGAAAAPSQSAVYTGGTGASGCVIIEY